jgi:hypothetical protein
MEIYQELERRKLTRSRRHASRELFGAATNYLSTRGDRGPSEKALINLFHQLLARRHFILAAKIGWIVLFGGRARAGASS